MPLIEKRAHIALIYWENEEGIGQAIRAELDALGYLVTRFGENDAIPAAADIIFLYGPFGKYSHLLDGLPSPRTQTVIFWNTEGLPDISWHPKLVRVLSRLRAWAGRGTGWRQRFDRGFIRFRYLGDFYHAHRRGQIDVLADISAVYADYLSTEGIPAIHAPFGSAPAWFDDRARARDIDVLWMGKFGSARRKNILRRLRAELAEHGVEIYMVDNVEHPFVYDDARTDLLHRTKITLNILRTWYDENSLRICMAAPNGSLVVSEPLLAHVPQYVAGEHYVSAPIPKLAETIVHYLNHPAEREKIAENARRLTTTELTFANAITTIMEAAFAHRRAAASRS